MDDRNNGETTGRDASGRFTSDNPGRPHGSRNKATRLAAKLLEDDAEAVVQSVIAAAKGGDMTAARAVLDRILPARKSRPVSLDLPHIEKPEDVAAAMSKVLSAVSEGEIDPDEGETIARVIEVKRRSLETIELDARLARLEEKVGGGRK